MFLRGLLHLSKCLQVRMLVCAVMMLFASTLHIARCQEALHDAHPLDIQVPYSKFQPVENNPEFIRTLRVEFPGAQFMRISFDKIIYSGTQEFSVWIVDGNGKRTELSSKAFLAAPDYITPVIAGEEAQIEVHAASPLIGLTFMVTTALVRYADVAASSSIVLPNDMQPIAAFSANSSLMANAKAVALLTFVRYGEGYSCSGFLIDNSRFLTNEHCVNDQATCRHAIALFGYDTSAPSFSQYPCLKVLAVSYPLDFALLELGGSPGTAWGHIDFDVTPPVKGELLYMIQHPGDEPKKVSFQNCEVIDPVTTGRAPKTDLSDDCDTLEGSSGSPLISRATNKVVALHHWGFVDGTAWAKLNRGVLIDGIRGQLP